MNKKRNEGRKRGGRPPKDYRSEIGKVYHRLIIRAILKPGQKADRSGARKVKVECLDCGKKSVTRLENVRSGHTKTCGCAKIKAYLQHLTGQVAKLPPGRLAELWSARQSGLSRAQCARKYRIATPVLDHALRTYERHLEALIRDDVDREIYSKLSVPGSTINNVAAELGLTIQAVQYLLKTAMRTVSKAIERVRSTVEFVTWVCSMAEGREPDFKKFRRGELSFKELRREKGKLVGHYAKLYEDCLDLLRCDLDDDKDTIADFVRLVKYTLNNRQARLEATRREMAREKQRAREHAIAQELKNAA